MIDFTLIRSKRKTIAIQILDGKVVVRAPHYSTMSAIERFITDKEKWIETHLKESKERIEQKNNFSLAYGDPILLNGLYYPITPRPGDTAGFDGDTFYIPAGLSPEGVKFCCIGVYRMLAGKYLKARTYEIAEKMSVKPSAVRINSAKTRWGSCSGARSINYSWMLIMADDAIIDYVIVHELTHITEMNHSARFWALVGKYIPDYQERKARQRELQNKLVCENWA